MLTLDLARLEREGQLRVQAEVPADAALWNESGLAFATPLSVDLGAQEAVSGEVVVRGRVEGTLERECRRCLEPVRTRVEQELTLVFAHPDLLEGEAEEGDVRPIPRGTRKLELGEAIREELILSVDPWVVCDPGCEGLCPGCGINLNEETCHCVSEELDPRWDALRALKSE